MSDRSSALSTQSLRMMRANIKDAAQYSDEELAATSIILGSLYSAMNDVPTFLPMKEQVSFFTNIVACFMVANLVNSGLINPHAAMDCLEEIEASGDDESKTDDIVIVGSKSGPVN